METFAPLYEEKKINLVPELAPEGPKVKGDAALLEQVVANLVDNAIRFTPPGGVIRITTATMPGPSVELSVTDSGPGIPEAERTRIFQRFVSLPGAETPGAGLGLAIVADIVKLHGGNAEAKSSPKGGAILTVTLPAAA